MDDNEFNEFGESSRESPQEFEEVEEKRITLARIIILGAVIFLAAFYYAWSAFLNFGTLEIKGEAPFDVIVFEEKSFTCDTMPCTQKLTRGEKTIGFYKHGHTAESMTAEIPLWSTVTITPGFVLDPYLEEIDELPDPPQPQIYPSYKLKYDSDSRNWKLIKEGDEREFGLSYFTEKIEKPLIIGTDKSVLIAERDNKSDSNPVYFIDLNTGQKNTIGTVNYKFLDAKPSLNGRNILFLVENPELKLTSELPSPSSLAVAGKSDIRHLYILADFNYASWTAGGELALAYPSGSKWIFSLYNPKTSTERILIETDQFFELPQPEKFFADALSRSLYFSAGDQAYKIVY